MAPAGVSAATCAGTGSGRVRGGGMITLHPFDGKHAPAVAEMMLEMVCFPPRAL